MKTSFFNTLAAVACTLLSLSSCQHYEDDGALQYEEKEYTLSGFERLEMGDAFIVRVEQGNYFSISVHGDRRNIDDLDVRKSGNTLVVRYDDVENRKHETYVDVVMPTVTGINFSGASNAVVKGFHDLPDFDLYLSGASVVQTDIRTQEFTVSLSGASEADLRGEAVTLEAEVSSASSLKAFNFPVQQATVRVGGASIGKLTVSTQLQANASGASSVVYRGNPVVYSEVSGASAVTKE
jgi:hypothetical protein